MKNLFDYIFYRAHKVYKKKGSNPEIYASGLLSLIQFFALIDFYFILQMVIGFSNLSKYYFIPILLIIIVVNWYQYELKIDRRRFEDRWGNENPAKRKQRGWLIVVSIVSLILFPILTGILKHNRGVI